MSWNWVSAGRRIRHSGIGTGERWPQLAGSFAELARTVLKRDFRRIDPAQARIIMIEAGSTILSHLPSDLSESATRQLEKLGVHVRTSTLVKAIREKVVELEGGETIRAENILWAAGVSAIPLTKKLGVELDRAGRVKVNPDLSVPGVSPAAMQMGKHVARLISDELELGLGRAPHPPFRYWDRGTMATIGRSAAVAWIGKIKISGLLAWLAWLFVHLIFLIGFRNKLAVLLQWAYSYFAYKRSARIITSLPPEKSE